METNQEITKREARTSEVAALIPPVDVVEDETSITVTADLAGVAKEDLAIRVDGDTLTIEAPISLGEAKNIDSVYAEIRAAHYKRSFTLSRELDITKIDAALKDGVLKLYVPKSEQAKPRRIEVKPG
jgi:HSP20 family protein